MNRTRLSHYQINQDFKESVVCVSLDPIDLSVDIESGKVIDGIELKKGDRVLIVGQANPVENGVYYASELGAAVRYRDFVDGLKVGGCILFVEEGIEHANTGWNCISNRGTDVVGTHPLYFKRFTGQSNWNQEDNTETDYIKNKPIIPETSAYDNHINTSAIHFEKTDIDYSDIQNTPDIPNVSAFDEHINTSEIHFEKTDIDYSDIQNTPDNYLSNIQKFSSTTFVYYVGDKSVDWKVNRYDSAGTKTSAEGTGTRPATLSECEALTYS